MKQSQITDPGKCAYLFDDLPRSIQVLVKIVQGLLVSLPWEDAYGAAGMPTFDVICFLVVSSLFSDNFVSDMKWSRAPATYA